MPPRRCWRRSATRTPHSVTGVDDVGGVVHAPHVDTDLGRCRWSTCTAGWPAPRSRRRPHGTRSLRAGRGSRWAVGARRSSTGRGRRCTWPCTLPSTALRTSGSSASSRWRWSAGRPTSGTLPRSSPGRSARPRRSRPACACCRGVPRRPRRLGLPSTAELDWKIRHRAARPRGTFHVQALAEADGLRERLRILRRALLPSRAWLMHEHAWARQGGLRLHRRLRLASGASARLGRPRVALQARGQARRPGRADAARHSKLAAALVAASGAGCRSRRRRCSSRRRGPPARSHCARAHDRPRSNPGTAVGRSSRSS